MKSLFLRMRVIHIAAFLILPLNAFFFTTNTLGAIIQYAIAIILIIHDVDEKKWGVDLSVKINQALASMDLTKEIKIDTSFNAESSKMLDSVVFFKEKIRHAILRFPSPCHNTQPNLSTIATNRLFFPCANTKREAYYR